jgi:hypothetical protein
MHRHELQKRASRMIQCGFSFLVNGISIFIFSGCKKYNMRYFPILLAVILFLFFGCEKEKINNNQRTIVTGKLTDAYTNKPIENGKITFYYSAEGSPAYVFDSIRTDNEGLFKLDYIDEEGMEYWFNITHPAYLMDATYRASNGAYNIFEFQFWPNGYLKFHIKNIDPIDSEDKIWVGFGYGQDYFFTGYGTSIDTTIIIPVISNVKYILNCFSEKNNHLYDHGNQIYCLPCDTLVCNIYY